MTDSVLSAPDGNKKTVNLPLNSMEQIFGYDGSNRVITITVNFNGVDVVQTLTRNGSGNVINISPWIPQSNFP